MDKEEEVKNEEKVEPTLDQILSGISIGAQLYNIIRKCGININPGIFKDFEHRSVKFIFDTAGIKPNEGKEEEVYTFDTFVRSYFESVAMIQYMFAENKRLIDKLKEAGIEVKDVEDEEPTNA